MSDRSGRASVASGGGTAGVVVDACDAEQLRRFFAEAGPIDDLVITVTGRGGAGPVADLADQDLTGAFAGSAQAALPGTVGLAAVNGALEAAVRPLARELAPRRVNAVSPGVIETGWWDGLPGAERAKMFETFAARTPVGRIGTAEDVAEAILGLAGNGFVTGVVLPCDGGLRLT